MAKFKLRSQQSRDRYRSKLHLTKAQTKILKKFSTNARELAKRIRAEARKEKARILKETTKISPKVRGVLTKVGALNTWTVHEAKQKARLSVTLIRRGKDKGKFRDNATREVISAATVNRRAGALKYHAQVRHIQHVLKGNYAQARKAYKAFLVAGILRATEFES